MTTTSPPTSGYALTGEAFDDERLAELLEPDRPHRYRVQHVVTTRMAGRAAPWSPDGPAHPPSGLTAARRPGRHDRSQGLSAARRTLDV